MVASAPQERELIKQQTMNVNSGRLSEFGIAAAKGVGAASRS
jgi:hypothetical protein